MIEEKDFAVSKEDLIIRKLQIELGKSNSYIDELTHIIHQKNVAAETMRRQINSLKIKNVNTYNRIKTLSSEILMLKERK